MSEFSTLAKPSYLADRRALPPNVQRKALKCEELLCTDFRHPGLQTKKLRSQDDLFEARVDKAYRLVYARDGEIIQLLAIGPHDIIDRRLVAPDVPTGAHELATRNLQLPGDSAEPGPPTLAPKTRKTRGKPVLADAPLPLKIDDDLLTRLDVSPEWHEPLRSCVTEEALLCAEVPERTLQRVIDLLFPPSIDQVRDEANLVVAKVEDLQRHSDGQLIGFLLELDPEQEKAVYRSLAGPAMVKGGAGTGKSTVALYRVKALIDRAVSEGRRVPRILFTTYTNALVEFSRQLLESLVPAHMGSITVSTVDMLAMDIVAGKGNRMPMVGATTQADALAASREALGKQMTALDTKLGRAGLEAVRDEYLVEEFEWVIEGRGVDSLEEYLTIDRRGRGYGFDRNVRMLVWQMCESYREYLAAQGVLTWKQLQRRALESIRSDSSHEKWDSVIVDEAQDLAPVGLVLAAELCRDPAGIFFAADGCQSIYHKGFRFSHVHEQIDLRGRSTVLKRNYRSTREIALAAQQIIAGTGAEDLDGLVSDATHRGEVPMLLTASSPEAQIGMLAREIKDAAGRLKLPVSTLGVLCPTNKIAEWCARALAGYGIRAEYMQSRDLKLDSPKAKVMTIHTAKGLEFPMVAVVRVEDGLLPRQLSDEAEDAEDHLNAQRRLLYVACTRAMRKLWVGTTAGQESPFVRELRSPAWLTRP